ncbi:MAG: response regulator, partial [Desulfobulbaceae bacterium]
ELAQEDTSHDDLPMGTERILFVDDEKMLVEMARSLLGKLGYAVTAFNSSLEALESFQQQPDYFDLVITDQTMPGMTGAEMARRMLQVRADIPIIVCTGYSSVLSEEKAKAIGIQEFVIKPILKKDIALLIRKVLAGKGG